jgi:hypothetical protein
LPSWIWVARKWEVVGAACYEDTSSCWYLL